MGYSTEFIKDKVLTHDDYFQFENAVAVVHARWRVTNSQYPNGFAYHYFHVTLNLDGLEPGTFIAVEDVTDTQLEAWCTAGITDNTVVEIHTGLLSQIQYTHGIAGLTTYYQNSDL